MMSIVLPLFKRPTAAILLMGAVLSGCSDALPTSGSMDAGDVRLNKNQPVKPPSMTQVELGRLIYFEKAMSRGKNQACASCHAPDWGFTGPNDGTIVTEGDQFSFYQGSITGRFGDRKPPSAAYAAFTPIQRYTQAEGYVGGLFWDGRAAGSRALTPIQEQVLGPFRADKEHAFSRVCILWEINTRYRSAFNALSATKLESIPFSKIGSTDLARDSYCHSGTADLPDNPAGFTAVELTYLTNAYNFVGVLVGAYEASPEVNPFASKWDDVRAGNADFTLLEAMGEQLFNDNCETCHSSLDNGANGQELFTDHGFYNLGLPRHPLRPQLKDRGLGAAKNRPEYDGFFRNPTLRNVDRRGLVKGLPGSKTFMHNGVLRSLAEVVHFYNTRDLKACPSGVTYGSANFQRFPTNADPVAAREKGICWPAPDYPETMSGKLGDLGLTVEQESALVAYMQTMTDIKK